MMEWFRSVSFLCLDDYGTGGIWFVVLAETPDEITSALPSVRVYQAGERLTGCLMPCLMTLDRGVLTKSTVCPSQPGCSGSEGWEGRPSNAA